MTQLDFGEDLALLRWTLPPLGVLMAVAGAGGSVAGQLRPATAGVLMGLGVLAAIWSLRVTTRRVRFDGAARQIHVTTRRGGRRTHRVISFDHVSDLAVRVLGRSQPTGGSMLGGDLQFELILVTEVGEFPLSRLAEQSLAECAVKEESVWKALGRRPSEPLLLRSYRRALVRRDRLQGVWLARLIAPNASLDDAEARVRRDWLA